MRETTMAIYGFDGFVLRKMFKAIFDLLCDVTGPNGHFRPRWLKNVVSEK